VNFSAHVQWSQFSDRVQWSDGGIDSGAAAKDGSKQSSENKKNPGLWGLNNDENMTGITEGRRYHDHPTSPSKEVMESRPQQPFKFPKRILPNQTWESQLKNTLSSISPRSSSSFYSSDFVVFRIVESIVSDSCTYNVPQNSTFFVGSVPFASEVKPVFGDFQVDEVIECLL